MADNIDGNFQCHSEPSRTSIERFRRAAETVLMTWSMGWNMNDALIELEKAYKSSWDTR